MRLKLPNDGRPVLIISTVLTLLTLVIFQFVVIEQQRDIIEQLQSYSGIMIVQQYNHLTKKTP